MLTKQDLLDEACPEYHGAIEAHWPADTDELSLLEIIEIGISVGVDWDALQHTIWDFDYEGWNNVLILCDNNETHVNRWIVTAKEATND